MQCDPTSRDIVSFSGEYRFLSNFYPAFVMFDDICFSCVENAYVAAKTNFSQERNYIATLTPGAAKRYGRTLRLPEYWNDDYKLMIMRKLVSSKFIKNPDLMDRLMATKGRKLIEGNTWRDTFWGMTPDGKGRNELGKILMSIRDDITNL